MSSSMPTIEYANQQLTTMHVRNINNTEIWIVYDITHVYAVV